MNILYLTNHLNIGGITSYVLTLAKGMKQRGHNVYVASSGGALVAQFVAGGIEYLPLAIKTKSEISYKVFASRPKLIRYIKEKNIDIIHANTRVTQVLSFLIQRTFGLPYISTCHGFFKVRLFRLIFPCWGNRVIAISESVKQHLIQDLKVNEADIKVIHNGIDVERFSEQRTANSEQRKKNLGLGQGPVIGIVARLSEEKGHVYLIAAMKSVLEKIPQAQLVIVGSGRMKAKLMDLTRNLGIDKNIFFIPEVKDTREVLLAMDLFILPSLKEGLGLALMEAMACGLAVVGSSIGGIKSLIHDKFNGLVVGPANVKELSGAITELLSNPEQAKSLGANARNFIRQNFSQEKMVSETERIYLECLNPK